MATEGQLQQEQAQQRKEANNTEAVARAETSQAAVEFDQVHRDSAEEHAAIGAEPASAKEAARNRQQAEHLAAEQQQHHHAAQKQRRRRDPRRSHASGNRRMNKDGRRL